MGKIISYKEFRETEAASASRLGDLAYSPLLYKQRKESDSGPTDAMIFGSAVDCMLTEPDEFDKRYYINEVDSPSDNIKAICDLVFEWNGEGELSDEPIRDLILAAAESIEYGKKWKPETVVTKVVEQGFGYYESKIKSKGKTILSLDKSESIKGVVSALKNSRFTSKFFSDNHRSTLEFKWQLAIVFEVNGVICKALLDLVVFDHENKRIYIYDIKTTGGSVYAFKGSAITYGYHRQGSFYHRAIQELTKHQEEYKDYIVANTMFIVAEQSNINPPVIYKMTTQDIMAGRHYGKLSSGREIKGYEPLLSELQWHHKNVEWLYPKEVVEKEGVIDLDLFGITPVISSVTPN